MIAPARGDGASQCVCHEVAVFAGRARKPALLQHLTTNKAHAGPARSSVCAGCCLKFLDGFDQFAGHGLTIAIQHAGVVTKEQGIFYAGEALALAALDDDDIL